MGSSHLPRPGPRSRRNVDYYELLSVAVDASLRDIEQAYWQVVKDRRDLVSQLNEAYEVLGDPSRREEYDRHRVPPPAETEEPIGSRPLRPNPDRNKLRWYLQ